MTLDKRTFAKSAILEIAKMYGMETSGLFSFLRIRHNG